MRTAFSSCERTPGYEWCMEHRAKMSKLESDCVVRQAEIARDKVRIGDRKAMEEAHAEGWHDDFPREFCPGCEA